MAINMDAVLELTAKVDGMSQVLQLENALNGVKGELKKYDDASKNATKQSGMLGAASVALGNFMLDAAYKAAEFVKQSVSLGFQYAQTENRLRMLSEGYGEFDQVQALVSQNAKTLGVSQMEASAGFADIYARLRPLGVGLEDVNAVYMGFNSLALQSGTTAEAASGAFMQLSQALGSGTLRGDEFNSVAEQVPGILIEVAEVMGQPVGALRGLAAEGKITSDVVIKAMRNAAAEGGASLGELTQSAANAGNRLSVAFQDAQATIGKELVPALAPFMDGLTEIVKIASDYLVPYIQTISDGWQWVASVVTDQLLPALDPLIQSVQRATEGMDITRIAEVWQGMMVQSINSVIDTMEFLSPIVAGVVDLFKWIMDNPVFNFIAEQVGKVADGFVKTRNEAFGTNEEAKKLNETMGAVAQTASTVATVAEDAKEIEKAKKEELKRQTEELKNQQSLGDAQYDQQSAILGLQQDQAKKQREKYDGTAAEFAVLVRIRDLKLKEAETDYKAAQDKISSQVKLGQMTQQEAEIRLETLKIQYESTKETINQAYAQEVLNEKAERLNEIKAQQLTTEQAITQQVAATESAIDGVAASLVNVQIEQKKTIGGWISMEQYTLAAAQAAYNYQNNIANQAAKIIELQKEGTKVAKDYAYALLSVMDSKTLDLVRREFMAQGLYGNGTEIPKFATGGYVTSPTTALIGEGGEPEYVIPASKMGAAAGAFMAGARGPAVLQPAATSTGPVSVNIQTGPVMNMGGEQYVRKTDMATAVNQAVAQVVQLLTGNSGIRQMVGF
jgi:tape measure domain-containing protein